MPGEPPVTDVLTPPSVLRVVNPVLRRLLTSRAARILPAGLVVLRFRGRRSGRTLHIVVGLHDVDGAGAVFTPAAWKANFRGGAPLSVTRSGRWVDGTGTLREDPEQVASALRRVIDAGTGPRQLGLQVAPGHRIDADDVRRVRRAMVLLDLPAVERR